MFSVRTLRFLLRTSFAIAGLALFYFLGGLLFNINNDMLVWGVQVLFFGVLFGFLGICVLKKEVSFGKDFWQVFGILLLNHVFGLAIIVLALDHPALFDRFSFRLPPFQFVFFLFMSLAAFYLAFAISRKFGLPGWIEKPRLFLLSHLSGTVLAGIFFVIYFVLAILFNRTEFYMIDSLFEGDHSYWLTFFGVDGLGIDPRIRAVHPLVYLFLRPLSWLATLLVGGNPYYGTLLLIAAMGALAVFLFWLFLYEHGLSKPFALLLASLFGATTTQLLFGSFAESYIFSAAALLLFFVLLQRKTTTLQSLIPAGLLVFGITISNVVQTITALFFVRKNIKLVMRYVFILVFVAMLLTLVNNALYPYESGYFFIPEQLLGEKKYTQSVLDFPEWKLRGRIYSTARNLLFYSVVAPSSFFAVPDPGKSLPRISFFDFSFYAGSYAHSAYDGIGDFLLLTWLFLVFIAGLFFLWSLRKRENWQNTSTLFSLALLANIAFNLVFHIIYGEDPFLYSADWTYALILFVGINLVERWWSKAYLLVFIAMLMINNYFFLDKLIAVLAQAV